MSLHIYDVNTTRPQSWRRHCIQQSVQRQPIKEFIQFCYFYFISIAMEQNNWSDYLSVVSSWEPAPAMFSFRAKCFFFPIPYIRRY